MSRIVAALDKLHRCDPLDAAIVDYLTIIPFEPNRHEMNVAQATAHQVGLLKTFADQSGIPILLLSQLNRGFTVGNRRADRLRNSGETLEKASVVITFDRPVLPETKGGDGVKRHTVALVSVEKNTDGATGACRLVFVPEKMDWGGAVRNGTKEAG